MIFVTCKMRHNGIVLKDEKLYFIKGVVVNNKKLLPIIVVSLSFSSPIASMEQYYSDCQQITKKRNEQLEIYKAQAINKDLNRESVIVGTKLISYKNALLAQKQAALDDIKKNLNIDDTAWEACMLTIKDVENFNKDNQSLPLPDVQHDATIPEELLLIIKEKLEDYGINPQRVNIRGIRNKPYIYSSEPSIPSTITKTWPGCSEDKNSYAYRLLSENVKPGKLSINVDLVAQLQRYSKAGLCLQMVEDIVQNGSLTCGIISAFEPSLTHQPGTIINSPQFKKFDTLCKTLSILLPTLNNPIVAVCMLQLCMQCYFPDFTTKDYNLLSKIEKNWRALSWLATTAEQKTKKT